MVDLVNLYDIETAEKVRLSHKKYSVFEMKF
jgi:hypothetical protein